MIPKFRAWHKEKKQMFDVAALFFSRDGRMNVGKFVIGGYVEHYASNHVELMQSTGIEDKNGKEAFNGDIINDGGSVGVIVTVVGKSPAVKLHHKNGLFSNEQLRFLQDFEIIGNIHQHPELLESK